MNKLSKLVAPNKQIVLFCAAYLCAEKALLDKLLFPNYIKGSQFPNPEWYKHKPSYVRHYNTMLSVVIESFITEYGHFNLKAAKFF